MQDSILALLMNLELRKRRGVEPPTTPELDKAFDMLPADL
jgi:hypothetical protein